LIGWGGFEKFAILSDNFPDSEVCDWSNILMRSIRLLRFMGIRKGLSFLWMKWNVWEGRKSWCCE
jgi:hypothetical protein